MRSHRSLQSAPRMSPLSVLISGCGIAGPTLAYWLHAAGLRPTVVESAPRLRTGGFAIDFWGLGYDIAEKMHLINAINGMGYRIRELRIVDERGERITGLKTRAFRELTRGRFVTLARSDLSRLLFEKIKENTEVIFGDEIVALREDPDGMLVEFKRAAPRRFDLVVGADGLHSKVRSLVFGSEAKFERSLGYLVAAIEARGYRPRDEDTYVMYCEPRRMIGRLALHGDRTLFLFVFAEELARGIAAHHQIDRKALLRHCFASCGWEVNAILDNLSEPAELYLDRVSQVRMPHWARGRVCLVGDAGFCVSLTAGQGSAMAMMAAYILAGELVDAHGSYPTAFEHYEQRLRGYVESKQEAARRFAAALAPRTQWGLYVRNQVIRIASIPTLARLAIGRDIVENVSLPTYAWSGTQSAAGTAI